MFVSFPFTLNSTQQQGCLVCLLYSFTLHWFKRVVELCESCLTHIEIRFLLGCAFLLLFHSLVVFFSLDGELRWQGVCQLLALVHLSGNTDQIPVLWIFGHSIILHFNRARLDFKSFSSWLLLLCDLVNLLLQCIQLSNDGILWGLDLLKA